MLIRLIKNVIFALISNLWELKNPQRIKGLLRGTRIKLNPQRYKRLETRDRRVVVWTTVWRSVCPTTTDRMKNVNMTTNNLLQTTCNSTVQYYSALYSAVLLQSESTAWSSNFLQFSVFHRTVQWFWFSNAEAKSIWSGVFFCSFKAVINNIFLWYILISADIQTFMSN